MSLNVHADKVSTVWLVGDDEPWLIEVGTFDIDAYEFSEDGEDDSLTLLGGGQAEPSVPATGFSFRPRGQSGVRIVGPISSIVAVAELR